MQGLIILALCACALGFRIERSTDYIIGGKDVEYAGKYPWQVSYQKSGNHFCGGSLIDDSWTLTAAHCYMFIETSNLKVVVGAHVLDDSSKGAVAEYKILDIVVNPMIDFGTLFFTGDICLVKVEGSVVFNDNVQPVEMAEDGDDFEGQTCVLTGWGRYDRDLMVVSNVLQEMETTVISRLDCEERIQAFGDEFETWVIADSHICFHNSQATACHGDSGGPAVCKKNGKWVLAGVTSGGNPTCTADFPNIYTRVSAWREFIYSQSEL